MIFSTLKAKLLAIKKSSSPQSLHIWNIWLAGLHAVQGIAVLLLSTTKTVPVETSYLTQNPLATEAAGHPVLALASHRVFDLNLAYAVAVFFFLAAITHLMAATVYRKRYEADLKRGRNPLRWVGYAVSAGTILVVIAVLTGITELSLLFSLFVLAVLMSLCGLAMEVCTQGKSKSNWLLQSIGWVAALAPWIILAVFLWGATMYGSSAVPAFVYWIFGTLLLCFTAFGVNMYLQYRKVGPWKNYLYGERVFMVLSLVTKTVLAWQVFAGSLRP